MRSPDGPIVMSHCRGRPRIQPEDDEVRKCTRVTGNEPHYCLVDIKTPQVLGTVMLRHLGASQADERKQRPAAKVRILR
jgi:hypothetical protein